MSNALAKLRLLAFLGLFCLAPTARAQFAVVEGRVVEAAGGQVLPGVNVVLEAADGTRRGTATEADGRFHFGRLPPGRYVFTASFVGYTAFTDTLTLAFGDRRTLAVRLAADLDELEEVVVATARETPGGFEGAGYAQVRPARLARVPQPDVSPDLMGYLLTLPGVVTTGDRGGQLFIRGGTPTQNLVMVDGMRLYQPFHIIGFYSIFPADVLAYADLYAGGFGARYGGRISSVIDVAMRNGSKDKVMGAVSVAPFLSGLRLEGPLVPGKVSFLASVRASAIARVAPVVLGRDLPYHFGDVFLKTHAYLSKTSSFSATALRTFDRGNVADTGGDVQASRWENQAVGLRYTYLPPDAPVLTQLAVYTSRFDSRYRPVPDEARRSAVDASAADIQFAYLLGPQQIHFGIFGSTYTFRYNLSGRGGDTRESVTEGGGYLEGRLQAGRRLALTPGLRLQAFSHGVGVNVEPRLRLAWRPAGEARGPQLSLAWGRYHQQIIGLNNPRDVTDAFVAWAPSPAQRFVPAATHLILGWQQRLGPAVDASVEVYTKHMDHLFFPRFDDRGAQTSRLDEVTGTARGLEVRLEASRAWFYGYVGYGLGLVRYRRGADHFSPPHDRRQQFNALVQVTRGPYHLGARWQYGAGLPFTRIQGYYESTPVAGPDDRGFHTHPGQTHIAYAAPYDARLPAYHRLDVSVDRRFEGPRWQITLQAALLNAYDRANIFTFDPFTLRRVDQLPLLPSIGLKVELK